MSWQSWLTLPALGPCLLERWRSAHDGHFSAILARCSPRCWVAGAGLLVASAEQRAPAAGPPRDAANADTLKQRDQELEAIRAEQRKAPRTRPSSSARSKRSATTAASSTRQLIDTAARLAASRTDRRRRRSASSRSTSEDALRKSLDERRAVIAEVLAALQRIGRRPPPALLVQPGGRAAIGAHRR